MTNSFYSRTSNPQTNSAGSSSLIRAEFALLEAGFDKLPTLTANGDEVVVVNAGATALETVPRATLIDTTVVAATSKTTPVDADLIPLVDSAASSVLKKLTWANLKATAKTYFDTLYLGIAATAANASQLLGKTWASPDPIGNTTPNTGAFTTLSTSSTVSGAGFTSRFATPGPIGNTTASTGAFTTLSASSTATLAAINQSDIFTNTSTNANPIRVTGATTGASYVRVTNTGGDYVFGAENSTGVNNLIVGATGYDMIIRAPSGIAFSANAGSAMQMRLSSAGVTVSGKVQLTDRGSSYAFTTPDWNIYNGTSGNTLVFNNGSDKVTLSSDGSLALTSGSMTIGSFTTATKPAHAAGKMIYVSDGGGGAVFQGSNGSAWVNLG